jgi:membrane protein required for colicin V production
MAAIDIVLLVLLALLILRAFLRGFVGEVFSLASVSLGVIGAVFFFKNGALFLRAFLLPGVPLVPEILAFIIIFLAVFILGKILEHLVRDIITKLGLEGLDRFLGFILGVVEGIALIALLLIFIGIQPLFDPSALLARSIFARLLLPLIGIVHVYV